MHSIQKRASESKLEKTVSVISVLNKKTRSHKPFSTCISLAVNFLHVALLLAPSLEEGCGQRTTPNGNQSFQEQEAG